MTFLQYLYFTGKKLNSGGSDRDSNVDLFGHEGPPTLKEKEEQRAKEIYTIQSCVDLIDDQLILSKTKLSDVTAHLQETLKIQLLEIVNNLSNRVKNLQKRRVGKVMAREKFKELGQPDWRKSKYVYVVGSIETSICQTDMCLKSLMDVIDNFIACVALFNNTYTLFHMGLQHIRLFDIENHCCLTKNAFHHSGDTKHIIQKSDEWFETRKVAKITGSTMYTAIGLDTLKGQQQHFDQVMFGVSKPEFTDRTKIFLQHGTDNEKNAKCTLLTKILPVYYPELQFCEEGCLILILLNVLRPRRRLL